jgi:NCS1 family nucleobase:cation symporter-1
MSADTSTADSVRIAGVEVRSIDYVPLNERHGKVWSQGPLWFMSNAQIATLAVGTFSVVGGGNLIWSLIAIVAGALLGTCFMAFHAAQGPQLGLPQMIQSRPQFGYVGALLVWLFAYVQYFGFNIFNTILAGDALHNTVHGSSKLWIVVATVLAVVVALVGYDLIHHVERWLTLGFLIVFGILTIAVGDTVPHPVRRRGRVPDQLGHLRLGLLPVPATHRQGAADRVLDVPRLDAGGNLADVPGRRTRRLGRQEVRHDRLPAVRR